MLPANYDFTIVRGTSGANQGFVAYIADSSLVPLSFDDARLSIWNKDELIMRLSTLDGTQGFTVTDVGSSQVTWAPSPAQSRQIPLGSKATYELEVRANSTEVVYLQGGITGIGGLNDDA